MLHTDHRIMFTDSRFLDFVPDESVDLVVTSPPYPMIEMWDEGFKNQCERVSESWEKGDESSLFKLLHEELNRVWAEVHRVLKPGGFACINIGDATRKFRDTFRLYPNHAKVLMSCLDIGFHALPVILWRKPTNAPTKFMGSGMLPAGAYVTLEHEYILILRKGGLRRFRDEKVRLNRAQSAIFWEERNRWYSDVWDIGGVRQVLGDEPARRRSGAFPFEIAYRLINMYSVRGDRVMDPFLGTGTTTLAAIASCRNSIGIELDRSLEEMVLSAISAAVPKLNGYISGRLHDHLRFVNECSHGSRRLKYRNVHYGFPIMTAQERELVLNYVDGAKILSRGSLRVTYHARASLTPPKSQMDLPFSSLK